MLTGIRLLSGALLHLACPAGLIAAATGAVHAQDPLPAGPLTPAAAAELARVIATFVKSIGATDGKSEGDSPAALPPIVQIVFSDEKK
jgi:hypothetical protein